MSESAGTITRFGTEFAPRMALSHWADDRFAPPQLVPADAITLSPAAHVLHYSSACFEGLKAHRGIDGAVRLFRVEEHVRRMQVSAEVLHLPVPDTDLLFGMIRDLVAAHVDLVPEAPGSLYLRPVLIGTEPNIGAAAAPPREGLLYVLASPVGDYFAGGVRPLKLLVETTIPRTTPQFGRVKSGANYAMALGPTLAAKARLQVDQVLFAPDGDVQETGAANFLLLDDDRIVTRVLDGSFLHGVTRDSILRLGRDLGYRVEERPVSVQELRDWAADGEAALSGTAAVLAGVGTLVFDDEEVMVGDGQVGPNVRRLRDALTAVQTAASEDRHGWTLKV